MVIQVNGKKISNLITSKYSSTSGSKIYDLDQWNIPSFIGTFSLIFL